MTYSGGDISFTRSRTGAKASLATRMLPGGKHACGVLKPRRLKWTWGKAGNAHQGGAHG